MFRSRPTLQHAAAKRKRLSFLPFDCSHLPENARVENSSSSLDSSGLKLGQYSDQIFLRNVCAEFWASVRSDRDGVRKVEKKYKKDQ
jgi:hypothetical protein